MHDYIHPALWAALTGSAWALWALLCVRARRAGVLAQRGQYGALDDRPQDKCTDEYPEQHGRAEQNPNEREVCSEVHNRMLADGTEPNRWSTVARGTLVYGQKLSNAELIAGVRCG